MFFLKKVKNEVKMHNFTKVTSNLFHEPSMFVGSRNFLQMRNALNKEMTQLWQEMSNEESAEGSCSKSFDMSGVKPEDIKINVTNDTVQIEGSRSSEQTNDHGVGCTSESKFTYGFTLPGNADKSSMESKFENGVLKLAWNNVQAIEEDKQKIPVKMVEE